MDLVPGLAGLFHTVYGEPAVHAVCYSTEMVLRSIADIVHWALAGAFLLFRYADIVLWAYAVVHAVCYSTVGVFRSIADILCTNTGLSCFAFRYASIVGICCVL